MTETSETPVGIVDRQEYYIGGMGIRSIGQTIQWDQELVRFAPEAHTFMLGGCSEPRSIIHMLKFIEKNFITDVNNPPVLYVVDIEPKALDKIIQWKDRIHEETGSHLTRVQLVQGDLLNLPIADGSVDYIRLDSTQNFIPLEKQQGFMNELNRVMSDKGIISDVVNTVDHKAVAHARKDWFKTDPYYKNGCIIQADGVCNLLMLSREEIARVSKDSGLKYWRHATEPKSKTQWTRLEHFVFTKQNIASPLQRLRQHLTK